MSPSQAEAAQCLRCVSHLRAGLRAWLLEFLLWTPDHQQAILHVLLQQLLAQGCYYCCYCCYWLWLMLRQQIYHQTSALSEVHLVLFEVLVLAEVPAIADFGVLVLAEVPVMAVLEALVLAEVRVIAEVP